LEGEAVEENRDILEWGGGALGGDHQFGSCGFSGRGFTLASAVFFDFPAAGIVAAVDLGSGFLGPVVFLVAVTLVCLALP